MPSPSLPPPLQSSPALREQESLHPNSAWDRSQYSPSSTAVLSAAHSSAGEGFDADIIPPFHPARTLVLCFDGTGDEFDNDNSNVVQLFSLLKKDDRNEQMVYYQSGIGTSGNVSVWEPLTRRVGRVLDEMVAWNLHAHVMGGYEFLMQNYQAGDKLCLFGFSRGAYTARALAGMLHKVGLLPACNHQQVPFAYKMFIREDEMGWEQSTAFKKAFCIDVEIEFIGVWDTVASVGLIPHRLPFTASNTAIRTFRHALALDERRARFKANHYARSTALEHSRGTHAGDMPRSDTAWATREEGPKPKHKKSTSTDSGKKTLRQLEREHERDTCQSRHKATDALEVWFAGCHCDIGGGSVTNDTPHNLARISLRWMIRECFKTNTGIRFHAELLARIGLSPAALHPEVQPRPSPLQPTAGLAPASPFDAEEEHEMRDALSPIFDQLALKAYWWLLEVLPMRHRVRNDEGEWEKALTINMGRGRQIPRKKKLYVHRSVKMRMEAQGLEGGPYTPKAQFPTEPIWVD